MYISNTDFCSIKVNKEFSRFKSFYKTICKAFNEGSMELLEFDSKKTEIDAAEIDAVEIDVSEIDAVEIDAVEMASISKTATEEEVSTKEVSTKKIPELSYMKG